MQNFLLLCQPFTRLKFCCGAWSLRYFDKIHIEGSEELYTKLNCRRNDDEILRRILQLHA